MQIPSSFLMPMVYEAFQAALAHQQGHKSQHGKKNGFVCHDTLSTASLEVCERCCQFCLGKFQAFAIGWLGSHWAPGTETEVKTDRCPSNRCPTDGRSIDGGSTDGCSCSGLISQGSLEAHTCHTLCPLGVKQR